MRCILLGTTLALGLGMLTLAPALAKTVKECNAEYSANKASIQGAQKKADFVAACRAGTEVIPGAAAAAPPAPAPTPVQNAAPALTTPVRNSFNPFARKKAAPALATPAAAGAPVGANQFTSEAQAKGRCPSGLVVWVNTKSKVYHFAGSRNYGKTQEGAFMCEADATAAGDRASKEEKRP